MQSVVLRASGVLQLFWPVREDCVDALRHDRFPLRVVLGIAALPPGAKPDSPLITWVSNRSMSIIVVLVSNAARYAQLASAQHRSAFPPSSNVDEIMTIGILNAARQLSRPHWILQWQAVEELVSRTLHEWS